MRSPRPRLAAVVVVGLALIPSPGRADGEKDPRAAAKKDLEKLQGEWVQVSSEMNGHPVPEAGKRGSEYKGDALFLKEGDAVYRRCVVTLDPSRTPKAINTWDLEGPFEDQVVPGIYEIDGDTLKLCFARPGDKRPTEFTTKSGTAFLLIVAERKKP